MLANINLRPYGKIINNIMYGDKGTISRITMVKDRYGANNPSEREEVYKDIRCKFSFSNIDEPDDSNSVYIPQVKKVTVFTDLDYEIKAGDYIEGYREDKSSGIQQLINGICGEPNRFDTHQEIPILQNKEN